ncbi:BET1-like [Hondaea fermentalgiana]|uniref:BET1-like n=1 Tax=Hondaea fermentalgiana TaxID=2315210 RepID=A0A2R5GE71_9STRA|nr:BET1-like [Hondaea fermentalgiana]|eukprot:GBG26104.1 BET1-like [Hondaea fermentalgiana]
MKFGKQILARSNGMATYRGSMSQRNDLFGNRAGGNSGAGVAYAEATRNMMEEENNRQTDLLGERVSQLKELSIQINGVVNEDNKLLDGMGSTFGQTNQLMNKTLKNLQVMIDKGGSKHMCYLILFVVAVFLVLYFMLMGRG